MIDESTEFGARVARHLRDEIVVWMTSVTPSGAPGAAAAVDRDLPAANDDPAYLAKYEDHIARLGMTPGTLTREYGVRVRIRLTGLEGY